MGTAGDDVLVGTSGDDVIIGLGGDDVIRGRRGKDLICGGQGDDTIRGGRGSDEILGGRGRDTLYGGKGDDILKGGAGIDLVFEDDRTDGASVSVRNDAAALDYFREIGFAPEFGVQTPMIRKWTSDVRIAVHGSPTLADLATLDTVIGDLNGLIDTVTVRFVSSGQNADIYFAPQAQFSQLDSYYVHGNAGFFSVRWNGSGVLYRATVLISTDATQELRDHLLREEVTQSLGLMSDSWSHPESVFYQGWSETHAFSALDRSLIRMLYRSDLPPGMGKTDAMAVLAAP